MNISLVNEPLASIEAGALVVGIHKGSALEGYAAEIDAATGGVLTKLIDSGEIVGKSNEIVTIHAPAGVAAEQVVVVGLGKADEFDRGMAFRAAGTVSRHLAVKERSRVVFALASDWSDEFTENAVCGAIVGCVGQDLYRSEKKRHPLNEVVWLGGAQSGIDQGIILGESMNLTRRLVNEPAEVIYPATFAEQAADVAKETGLTVEIWDEAKLEKERCGSLLAVGRGSQRESRLVILRHNGGPSDQAPLALVGKGVTFDSGGLSLKPSDGMKAMKCDMAGAATVLGAMRAIASLNLPVNVVGLVGLAENMVSGRSYKLGDVLTARSGKTIEVLNTDAEGRLVLADVLDVAVEQEPQGMIDLATLTGACLVALGQDVAGLMTNNDEWCTTVKAASAAVGELTWELPMFPHFNKQIRSEVADIKNIGEGRMGGTITAAKFLEEFVGEVPWTHIDIAGPAFTDKPKPYVDAGGSGAMVRTLVEVARRLG